MITIKEAVKKVTGYTKIKLMNDDGDVLFEGKRQDLVMKEWAKYSVEQISFDRSCLTLEVERSEP